METHEQAGDFKKQWLRDSERSSGLSMNKSVGVNARTGSGPIRRRP
jgi:hypothetical protein